jgi:hypothetical protein
LYFHNDNFSLAVSGFYINAVELIIFFLLITFTFQYFYDFYFFIQKYGKESFQNVKISFLTE